MFRFRFIFAPFVLGCFLSMACSGASSTALPTGGVSLMSESSYSEFSVVGDQSERVEIGIVDVDGPGFTRALSVRTISEGKNFLKVQAPLHAGEIPPGYVMLARFFARTVESPRESGEGGAQFELDDCKTFTISGQFAVHAVQEWREILVPLRKVGGTGAAGNAVINFRVGDQRQTIQIGGLQVLGYGKIDMAGLPATPVNPEYEGMQQDAPWRAAAQARIERHRMADLEIKVVSHDGQPVADASVAVRQKSHDYRFGSAVRAGIIMADTPVGERYRASILKFFNAITLENDLKWGAWLKDRETPLQAAQWASKQGLALRGHTMVWAHKSRMPASKKHLGEKPDELRKDLADHVNDVARTMSPNVAVWDVINEPFRNHDFMDLLGDEVMIDWFKLARAAAPEAVLYLNDYGIVSGGGMDEVHQAHFEKTARYLIAGGAPLGGLGFQGHFGRILTPPERMLGILDRYAPLEMEMELTEYSTQIEDRELNATYLRDILTIFFSHPSTSGFILWGFQDGAGWKHYGTLEKAGAPTPAGEVWLDLIYKKWWTNADLRTAPSGVVSTRAFKGAYDIEVEHGGKTTRVSTKLGVDSQPVVVRLPAN